MPAKPFLDTNVVVYAFSLGDSRKARAEDLLTEGGTISVQVLNEFVNVSRRRRGRDWATLRAELAIISEALEIVPILHETHCAACDIAQRYGFSIYDGTILGAAKLAGCRTLYSEDLTHGQVVDGVTIRNPFVSA